VGERPVSIVRGGDEYPLVNTAHYGVYLSGKSRELSLETAVLRAN